MKTLESLLLALIAVFAPIQSALATVMVLIVTDLITGVLAAKKRGEPISSSELKRTVGKILLYQTALCIGFIVQQNLIGDLLPVVKLISALVGITELKSVLENLNTLSGSNLFKVLIDKIVQTQSVKGTSNEKEDETK